MIVYFLLIVVWGVLSMASGQRTTPLALPSGSKPCGDFPWTTNGVSVNCDYDYSSISSWSGHLHGKCVVNCPVEADLLVGPPAEYFWDGAYYCNARNSTWVGTEPVCLGHYDSSIITTEASKGMRLVGGESYGCVELYDNVTQQWGPVRGRYWPIMKWIDLSCRNLGFNGALASSAYELVNGVVHGYGFDYLPARYHVHNNYPSTVPKFVLGTFPQWEGATLQDAIARVVRGECPTHDYNCRPYSLCVSCAGQRKEDYATDIDARVSCTSDYLEVTFARSPDNSVQAKTVQLAAPPCKAEENSTHVYIRAPLGACGTSREDTPDEMIYRNTLTIGADPSHGGITWQQLTKVPVECRLPRNKTLSLDFRPHLMSVFRSGVQGRGDFQISMDLFRTGAFLQPVTEYPVFVELREMINVQIQVNSTDSNLRVLAHTCVATPSDKQDDKLQNDVIVDGCAKLPTLQFYQSPGPERERFGFQAFAYTSGVDMVYIHCNVLVCNATDQNSRCAQGCQLASGRRRRSAEGDPDVYRLIQGPIVVGDRQNDFRASDTNSSSLYLEIASIVVGACAVIAVAMFSVGILYKARQEGSKAGYSVLENVN